MSQLQPNPKDSIKEKCAKACFLYFLDYITLDALNVWLMSYKNEFEDMEFVKRVKKSI